MVLPKLMRMKPFELGEEDSLTSESIVYPFSVEIDVNKKVTNEEKKKDEDEEKALPKKLTKPKNTIKEKKIPDKEQEEIEFVLKWKYAANVMNRFFLYLSTLAAVAIFIAFFAGSYVTMNNSYQVPT